MRRVGIVLMFAVLIMFASNISATIINIPENYLTIQEGIDASTNGDTVRVESDIYYENIFFSGENIVVGSWFLDDGDTSYISSTIIDGNQSGSVVSFFNGEDNSAVITGFTIQNGHTSNAGGIYCYASNPTISNNTISGNWAGIYGGGIFCDFSSPTINYNAISGNTASEGGGISCIYDSSPTISYNTITGNSADDFGGGIGCSHSSPTISNNTISENSAVYYGGGIYCDESSPTVSNNTISENSATESGGGIYCYYNSNPTINNNTISGNTANIWGGGIVCELYSNPNITNTIFWADSAPSGPEIYLYGTSSPVITYCDVQGGWAGETNIDCDPMFCYPDTDNYYLHANSCCVGAGESGVDIGAFGVGCGEEIPTLSEWGMILLALLLLSAGTVAVIRRRKAVAAE